VVSKFVQAAHRRGYIGICHFFGASDHGKRLPLLSTRRLAGERHHLKRVVKSIGGSDYLFVKTGGFSATNKPDWKSQWWVMKQSADEPK
jgi:hypothetical protein